MHFPVPPSRQSLEPAPGAQVNVLCNQCGTDTGSCHKNRRYCTPCREQVSRVRALDRYRADPVTGISKAKAWQRANPGYRERYYAKLRAKREAEIGPVPRGCEICGECFGDGVHHEGPHWDHNHSTGAGRGWLCRNCNSGLGSLGDNPRILERAAEYLRKRGAEIKRPVIR